jgi:hypothetical protein
LRFEVVKPKDSETNFKHQTSNLGPRTSNLEHQTSLTEPFHVSTFPQTNLLRILSHDRQIIVY